MKVNEFWAILRSLRLKFTMYERSGSIRQKRTLRCPVCAVAHKVDPTSFWRLNAHLAIEEVLILPRNVINKLVEAADSRFDSAMRRKLLAACGFKGGGK